MAEAIRNIFNLTGLARRPHALGGLLVLLTVLAYVPAINAGYIWDDDLLLTANPHMRSLQGLGNIWLGQTAADYAPLTWTSFWIGTQLWNAAPIVCHTINILLHATSAVLLWRVLTALRIPGGWFAALLFAIHPVNVASVAWVAERKNTLSAVFFFASLLAFIAAYQRPDRKLYLTSILLFLLAALSKGAVVTLPLVLVGCIFWIKRKLAWRDILTIAPFGVVSAIIACLTIRYHSDLMNYQLPVSDVASRIARAGCLPWFYLGDLVLPVGLTPMSAVWDPAPGSLVYFLSPLLILVVLGIFVWRRHSWGRPLLFISGYYLWMLFPVLGFIWIAFQQEVATADWWQYLAAPGIFAAAGAAIVALTSSARGAVRSSLVATICLVMSLLVVQTWRRCAIYESMESYSRAVLAETPELWTLQNNLGVVLKEKGLLDRAARRYRLALRENPKFASALNNLGNVLAAQEKWTEARSEFEAALRQQPANPEIMANLSRAYFAEGRIGEALSANVRAIKADASNPERYTELGEKFSAIGQHERAAMCFNGALLLAPGDARSRIGLIRALLASGKSKDAAKACQDALNNARESGNGPAAKAVAQLRVEYRSSLSAGF